MFCLPWDNWDNLAVKAAAGPGKMETYSFLNWTPKRGSVILYDCLLPVPDWGGGEKERERLSLVGDAGEKREMIERDREGRERERERDEERGEGEGRD